jgi:solute carrier family 5 (sodium-coupled monocarboxylate transporter), member 8/12
MVGSTTALSVMTWICFKAQQAISTGEIHFAEKDISTNGCTYQFTNTSSSFSTTTTPLRTHEHDESLGFQIYHISYIWYTLVGSSICIIVSLVASYIIGPNNPKDLNPQLLAPFVRKLIIKRSNNNNNNTTVDSNMTETSFQVKSKALN